MPTLDDVRAFGKPLESQMTTLGTTPGWGEKYSLLHSPFPIGERLSFSATCQGLWGVGNGARGELVWHLSIGRSSETV